MANSYIEVSRSGSSYVLPASFNYLDIDDIHALGKENNGTYNVLTISSRSASSRTIVLSGTPSQPYVRFYRTTSSAALVDFVDGARLTEADLDKAYRQGLYAAQEVLENASTGLTGYNITNIASSQLQLPLTNFSSTGIDDNATSTALTIDSSERVGISETSPLGKLHVKSGDSGASSVSVNANELVVENSDYTGITILGENETSIMFGDNEDPDVGRIEYHHSDNSMRFRTNASDKMRIDSSGRLLVGTTSTTPNPGVVALPAGQFAIGKNNSNDNSVFIEFRRNASQIGGVVQNGTTGVSYNTSSDHRLKENVTADWDATTRLKQLNPVRFNFIADADTTVDGFLAHEVQSVVPEAINGTHNEVDADGNPVYQGIDQAKLVPLLVKTIQELEARVTALEA